VKDLKYQFLQSVIRGKGVSNDEIANYLGINENVLNLFLSGVLRFSEPHRQRLSQFFGYSEAVLFS